ncbi:MAG: hypothetical protein GEU75_04100 [Dehalococcoidia bacterium]|nr:hypothetical protein [Dehalococcoidia bacterium]
MRLFRLLLDLLKRDEEGQIVLLSALVMTVVIAFSAVAIDVGFWLHTRTKLQADADAMAIAGAQMLCGEVSCDTTAITVANSYASKNDLSVSEVVSVAAGVNCAGGTTTNHDWITVRVRRDQEAFLSKILGITDAKIVACATAGKYALGGFEGIVPFGIEDDCLGTGTFGATYTLKYDSDTGDTTASECDGGRGNFGALAVDTSGAGSGCSGGGSGDELKFKQALCFGANREVCAEASTDCIGQADDDSCGGSVATDSQSCTETGNMTGPIKEGLGYRVAGTSSLCNEWSEVTYAGGGLTYECNPWIADGPTSMRVIMIPIVDGLWDEGGRHVVDIVGFAIFFIETFDASNCKGSDCDIEGRFIKTQMSTGATGTGELGADSLITFAKLIN